MTKVFRKKNLFLFFFLFFDCLRAQEVLITNQVNAVIRRKCPICSLQPTRYYNPSQLRSPFNIADICYHNCHLSLSVGKAADAYHYAQITTAVLTDSLNHPLYSNTIFLLAKINQSTDSLPAAINRYKSFLSFVKTDSVLSADAYVSLTRIYLERGEWEEMDKSLNTWYSGYSYLSDSLTKRTVYDSIVTIFSLSRNIPNHEAAIRTATDFFSNNGDSNRLRILYYNIAAWYEQRSRNTSAILYFKKGLTLAIATNNLEEQQKFYLSLSLVEEKRRNFQAALRYRKLYEEARDRMLNDAGVSLQNNRQKKSQISRRVTAQQ